MPPFFSSRNVSAISGIVCLLCVLTINTAVSFAKPSSYIVKVRSSATAAKMLSSAVGKSAQLQAAFPFASSQTRTKPVSLAVRTALAELEQYYVLTMEYSAESSQKISELEKNQAIESIEPMRMFHLDTPNGYPNDSLFDRQWAMKKIGADKAWKSSTGKGILVGVIDTGTDFLHPDLQKNLWINSQEDLNHNGTFEPYFYTETRNGVSGDLNGIDDDGNGYTDDVTGYDFVDQSITNIGDASVRDAIPYDEQGHGTSVAGIIGAEENNRLGVAGIAYDCKLVSLRAFDATGNAEEDDIAAAIVYAALNGVRVLNMSFGDVVYSPITRAACQFAESMGVTLVASAGNDGSTLPRFPASYPEVISVAATNDRDLRASFSSFGSQLTLSAPGVAIPTTAVGGKYKNNFQGTSAAAPHVAAAAALILENNPGLRPAEVRGILQASCDDLGAKGWDTDYGAGRLNCATAVALSGTTMIGITSPENDAVIRRDRLPTLDIRGDVATPLFSSWKLWLGPGEMPPEKSWIAIGEASDRQSLHQSLGSFSTTNLQDTTYTLRLVVELTNGNSIERRVRFDVLSAASHLDFQGLSPAQITAWFNTRRTAVITAQFSERCRCYVTVKKQGTSDFPIKHDDIDHFSRQHSIALTDHDLEPGIPYDCEVVGILPGADTVRTTITVTRPADVVQQTAFVPKDYTTVPAQLNNSVKNLHGEGDAFAISDRSDGTFGSTKIIQFSKGTMTTRDSTAEVWIPKGMGDSNGDGVIEVLAHSLGATRLFQGKSSSESPFKNYLFSENDVTYGSVREFWPAALADLTGDGREEIIGFSDTVALVYTYRNGKYELLATAPNDTPRGESGSPNAMRPPNCAVGDFDGDGNIELCFGDTDGDFLVYEYKNGSLTKEYTMSNDRKDGGSEYVTAADVDGDGKPEFLVGYYSSPGANGDREYEAPLWTFKLYKSLSANTYRAVWTDQFYGVRAGLEYQSGVSAGDLDGQKGDEIIIAPFPNLYVFKWKETSKTLVPLWNYYGSYTSAPIVHDFDANGRNELGFSDGAVTSFWELPITPAAAAPLNFTATVIDSSSVRLSWTPSPGADEYAVYKLRSPSEQNVQAELVGVTAADSMVLDTLRTYTLYRFFIRSITAGVSGLLAQPVDAYLHPRVGLRRSDVRGTTIALHFSGLLGSTVPPIGIFRVRDGSGKEIPLIQSVQIAGDSTLLLLLHPVAAGIGQTLQLLIEPFEDRYGMLTIGAQATFSLNSQPRGSELYLTKLTVHTPTSLRLEFSEAFAGGATDPVHYTFRPFGVITAIDSVSPTEVVLSLSTPVQPLGSEYTLTVRDVRARSGNIMTTGAGNTLGFTLTSPDASAPFAFPNPVTFSDNQGVTFANVPSDPTVTVYSLDMKVLATLTGTHNDGGVNWDGQTADGSPVPTGIYLFRVRGRDAGGREVESELVKFAVIR